MKNPINPLNSALSSVQQEPSHISFPPLKLTELSREKMLAYFKNTWDLTELLFSGLRAKQAFYQPPYHNLRHPLIFYYGHTVVCYVNKLRVAGIISGPINSYFEDIFEIGVDEMSWDDLSKNTMRWPEIEEVKSYREIVYKTVIDLIQTHPAFNITTISPKDPAWALMLALEHERIHFETSSVLIRELPIEFVSPPHNWPKLPITSEIDEDAAKVKKPEAGLDYPINTMMKILEQTVTLGKNREIPFYGWDNEYGNKKVDVKPFSAGKFLVTNGEFFQFVTSQGYHEPRYWPLDAGKWRSFRNIKYPTFWVAEGPDGLHKYKLRTCFEIIPMQWSWPVIVNYYEAKAYCLWLSEQTNKKIRLLTEAEHHCLRDNSDVMQGNIGLQYGSESPVQAFDENAKGFHDVFGNIWQWMEDHFCPLPGFKVHPYYTDFSTPCFDGAHHMIMGGSFISTGDEATPWARFHFRPHFYQHAGFRIVQADHLETSCMDCPPPYVGSGPCCSKIQNSDNIVTTLKHPAPSLTITKPVYETESLLNEYLLLHYGDYAKVVGRQTDTNKNHVVIDPSFVEFPKRCADLIKTVLKKYHVAPGRFLDIGCAVGRVCFELSPIFNEVIGIDTSKIFIETANELKLGKNIKYARKEEGDIFTSQSVILPKSDNKYINTTFQVQDACHLPKSMGLFNVILMANVLCRVPDPKQCLLQLTASPGFLSPNGLFMLLSPYSWLENFTEKSSWLGGLDQQGKQIFSRDAIIDLISSQSQLKLIDTFEMPLLIREHARKYQLIIADGMIWQCPP